MKLLCIENRVYKVKDKKYYTLIALLRLDDKQPYQDYLKQITEKHAVVLTLDANYQSV